MMIQQQAEYDLLLARHTLNTNLHEIELSSSISSRSDFSQGSLLYEEGYELMSAYLEDRSARYRIPPTIVERVDSSEEALMLPISLSIQQSYAAGD